MRITFIQLFLSVILSGMAYSSTLNAQNILDKKISITLNNASLINVLNYLQKNDGVKFIYSNNAIDVNQQVSVDAKNLSLKNVLDQVLKSNGITYEVLKDRIILSKMTELKAAADVKLTKQNSITSAEAISIPITGKVIDKNGQPVIGASILEKGTTNGTTTDVNGNFKLNVEGPASVLTIAYIGYNNQEVTVGNQTDIAITLVEDVKALNEVVVVGYGTQRKATVTGAISSVKASDLQDQQVTRIDDALKGRTAGVNVVQSSGAPGSAPSIRIRGITSINNSDPLYVIDGVIVDNGGIDNINPNDVESIDVLKDASAAIYGSRASNGVIIITTKKGKQGPPKISYNGYIGFQGPVNKPELANASQYAMLRNEAVTNDGGTAIFANPESLGVGTNWQDQIFSNNALIQNHNLSINGATDKANYYTSFGYLDQDGIVMPSISNYKKFTFTTNTSYKVKKWLTIGENFTYSYTRNKNSLNTNSVFGGPLSSALNLDPLTPTVVTDINGQPNAGIYTSNANNIVRDAQGNPYGISNYVSQEITNPLAYVKTQQGNYGYATNLLGSAFIEVEPVTGFKFRSQISAKQAYYGSKSFTPIYYLNSSTSNLSNTSLYLENDKNLSWNIDNTLTYTHSFGKNNVTALIGTSAQKESGSGLGGTFLGLPVNTFNESSPNYALPNANKIANGFDNQPYTLASYFGRVTYDYDQKFLFTGIIRRDGSSKFGSNNVYGTFPSAQVGYVMSREGWFPTHSFIDYFKIRGSYGIVGNEMSLAPFQYTATIGSGRNYVFGDDGLIVGYSPNAPSNPNLRWEETRTANIGFDATLLNNLTVTFDIYKKTTKGMLQTVQLPAYAGFSAQPSANIGDMENKGVELNLGYSNRIGEFNYNIGGNISYNHNEVTYLGDQINFFKVGSVQNANYEIGRTEVGHPVGAFYGFEELGVFHSQAEIDNYKSANGTVIQPNAKPGDFKWNDTDGDGKITDADRKFLGNPLPTFTYGINFSANYRNFDIKLFGQGVWGNKIYQAYRRLDIASANYPIAALDAWTPTNTTGNYPRLTDSDPNNNFKNPSNFYLQNGAYFRIKTLQLGYTLPGAWLKKADVQRARVFLSSNNLATITGYKGYDPEISGGIDMGIYPQARTFMVGLDVTL
ncbi:TonB-dependent receptor [Mucilaginibacter segetis]|uniref:TonB-dependent receptor n=1 Tax=Mucilaginibacter segetis TaxID=2793071 RepID=A0A934ULL3_9SPHI|nr:TonB-dependent receptor [Mucilaginibacter segetis]MBK0377962.1 TonB-dependent receptor [Mucilaginibacter segetis]